MNQTYAIAEAAKQKKATIVRTRFSSKNAITSSPVSPLLPISTKPTMNSTAKTIPLAPHQRSPQLIDPSS